MNYYKKIKDFFEKYEKKQKEKEYAKTLETFRQNNLSFVTSCGISVEDKIEMMESNYHYYRAYLRNLKADNEKVNDLIVKTL
jgi:hypothetical protein